MRSAFVHPTAIVESESIGAGSRIWAYAHVLAGAVVGKNVNICDHSFIEGGAHVGDNVTIKNNVCVWDGITIEDDVFVGPGVTLTNDDSPRSRRMAQAIERYAVRERWLRQTTLRRGCSIGANATILPGLELGRYCLVGAAAIVTKDVGPFQLVLGAPARVVASVCRCGSRLVGSHTEATCASCGETPKDRL